ncbi:MAG: hypothetical protein HY238_13715 [Acidobacteria bacterium]|nr:hypothetical protein [Acidobacteriota bacterium]
MFHVCFIVMIRLIRLIGLIFVFLAGAVYLEQATGEVRRGTAAQNVAEASENGVHDAKLQVQPRGVALHFGNAVRFRFEPPAGR